MAFHDGLSCTQQILLAIFCFPLLPFYLCYLCCLHEESEDESNSPAKAEEGSVQEINNRPRFAGRTPEIHRDDQQPVVAFKSGQNQVPTEVDSGHNSTPQRGKVFSGKDRTPEIHRNDQQPVVAFKSGQNQVTTEVDSGHNSTPQRGKVFSGKDRTPEIHRDDQQPVVAFKSGQNQVTTEVDSGHNSTPQRGKGFSGKRILVPSSKTGQYNQGFQDDGEQPPTLSGRHGLYAYPWDKSNLKSMSIDLDQFKKLDAYAKKVDVRSSVENLVRVLLQIAHSDLEKVRAIWMWICHHIEYDVEGYHNEAKRSCEPTKVLQSGKSVCAGYAALFEEMCSLAGIKCKTLSGFSKGFGYKPGMLFRGDSDHAWNAVSLDGRWHLLDSTWGSGSSDDTCHKFTFRYDEFYFLTHPALFISDHFPKDEKWQLLKKPLTLQQFEQNVRYRSDFYTAGLLASSAGTCVIETENGKATIFIESRSPALFMFKLNGVDEHGLMTLQKNGVILEVYPRQTGTHKLDIYAKPFNTKETNYRHVLEHSLKCHSVDKSVCLPKDLIQPVGPSWLSEEKGILEALPTSPVIHTEDGRCIVTFTQDKDLDVFATLDSDSSRLPEKTRRRHIWKICKKNQVEFKIHLPHAGTFALNIWAKKASQPGSSHCALSYLLSCPNKNVKWPVFPQSYTNWEDDYELVAPLAGVLPANRNVEFKLKLPGVDGVSVECGKTHKLTLGREGLWEGTCNTSGGSKVTVRISKNGDNTMWSLLEYQVENH